MAIALRLTHDEPRLVYLALVYHLGRPGSELDPATRLPVERGLRHVMEAVAPALAADSVDIELDGEQYRRLLSAIYGAVNELRVHHMRGGVQSTVAGFTDAVRATFPEVAVDPAAALDIAEAMMMLHRRIERAVARAARSFPPGTEPEGRRRRWPFGR